MIVILFFRSILDPISILDRGAITVATGSVNPLVNHDYITGYYDQGKQPTAGGDPIKIFCKNLNIIVYIII